MQSAVCSLQSANVRHRRNTKDMVKFSGPQSRRPERVPVTKKLLSSVRSAHAAYRQKCEKEKKRKKRQKLLGDRKNGCFEGQECITP